MSFQDVGRTGQSRSLNKNEFHNNVTSQGPSIGALSASGGQASQLQPTMIGDGNFGELSNSILQYQVF